MGGIIMIDKVTEYYDLNAEMELDRLSNPYSNVEFIINLYLMDKYFPKKGRVLDIGSGPGRYSIELAKKGYDVELLDISEKELDIASKLFEENDLAAKAFHVQSATDLRKFKDESFDAVLCMGPMYHLHHESDRLEVLKEIKRILTPNGRGFVAYINTLGVMKASIFECPDVFDEELNLFHRHLSGNLALSHEESFTSAYFTTPAHALDEVRASGLEVVSYAGSESFMSGMHLEMRELEKTDFYDRYIKMACLSCEHAAYRDATEHLAIIVAKK
jgi:ubiquinone/menaquinone biosynthesis C-methylase UbiE